MALRDYVAEEIAHDAASGLLSRREALRRLGLLGLTAAGATALLAACGGDDDSAAGGSSTTTEAPASTTTAGSAGSAPVGTGEVETIRFDGSSGELQGAWAAPADPTAAVLVIHENRGLTPHFHDLVGR